VNRNTSRWILTLTWLRPSRLAPNRKVEGASASRWSDTVTFEAAADRLAWGINLDIDADGRLIGIEFESANQAPAALRT
jgi:Protein of unknown function (DUF2283)